LKGGRFDDIRLSNHYDSLQQKDHVILLSPRGTQHPRYIDYGWVAKEEGVNLPGADTLWRIEGNQKLGPETPVTLVWENGQGLRFERRIEIDNGSVFKITQRAVNNSGREITLYPFGLITQTGFPQDYEGRWILHEGPIGYVGEDLLEVS